MAFTTSLLGPPGITSAATTATAYVQSGVQNLSLTGGRRRRHGYSQLGFTENNSLTYLASGNPCLDFFFHVVPGTPSDSLIQRLTLAWAHDPLLTLKLVCNLRGVRGTGKSDKERFYVAALWLHKNHPKTLACNVRVFAEFGYYKDLLEILYRLLEGQEARQLAKREWESKKSRDGKGRGRTRKLHFLSRKRGAKMERKTRSPRKTPRLPKDVRVAQNKAKIEVEREHARQLRKEKDLNKAKKAYERYSRDPVFRFLHDCIADLFAEELRKDMQVLNSGEVSKISLAAKWCPSIDSAYDKITLICESIARRVFPRESDPEYEGIEEAHYVYRVRDRLRKQVLVPLHRALELPEVYMSANRWESLPYNRVPSVAMKNYKEHFLRHDNNRFNGYLEDVKKGDAKIAAGALLPHDIIASLKDGDGGTVAELQWARMVEDMAKIGKLNNCIAVCDVSSSMNGTPMEVCVALGMLISELSEEPWKGKVITFSQNPQLHLIRGKSLLEKTQFVRRMDWGGNTDFQKTFDQILQVAVNGRLREDQMVKKIFVFSDMEFDQAAGHHSYSYDYRYGYDSDTDSDIDMDSDVDEDEEESSLYVKYEEKQRKYEEKAKKLREAGWETDYEVIQRKFREKGFNNVPDIVFWNLRDSSATPVSAHQSGVALVSGYSKNMAKLFLDNGGIINPVGVMEKAISGEMYEKLVVYD